MSSLVDCELETAENPKPECETISVRVSDLALGYSKTLDLTHFLSPYGIFQNRCANQFPIYTVN